MSVAERRERERQERRAQIVQAAGKVFKSKGFQAATMDDIASEAEVSKGTLYLHFKNKDDLFFGLSSLKLSEITEEFKRISDKDKPGLAILGDMLAAYANVAMTDPDMFRIAVVWVSCPSRADMTTPAFCQHAAGVMGVMQCLIGAIERGQADGSVRADIVGPATAGQLWAGMLGTLLVRINAEELARRVPGHNVDPVEHVPGFIRLVCDGLRPRETST